MHLVLFVLVFTFLGQAFARDCSTGPGVNGCDTWKLTPYIRRFTPACNKHDVCYYCGQEKGVSRLDCDQDFRTNMYNLCGNGWCMIIAKGYYTVVRRFGKDNYETNSPDWCKESWVSNCMP